jgi:hypothetical protein
VFAVKQAVGSGSGDMIPSFIKTCSGIQKLVEETHTDCWEVTVKQVFGSGSCDVIPSFIKTTSDIQQLVEETHTDTQTDGRYL